MTGGGETWRQARDAALADWRRLEASIGKRDEVGLLADLNARFALCDRARAESPDELRHCPSCLFFEQFGGCREISAQMSEKLVEGDLEGLRELVGRFLRSLEALRLPPEAVPEEPPS